MQTSVLLGITPTLILMFILSFGEMIQFDELIFFNWVWFNHQLARVCVQKVSCHPYFTVMKLCFIESFLHPHFGHIFLPRCPRLVGSFFGVSLPVGGLFCRRTHVPGMENRQGLWRNEVQPTSTPTPTLNDSRLQICPHIFRNNPPPQMVQQNARSKYWCFTREPGGLTQGQQPRHFPRYAMARPRLPRAWSLLGGRNGRTLGPWLFVSKKNTSLDVRRDLVFKKSFTSEVLLWPRALDLICLQGSRKVYECVSKKGEYTQSYANHNLEWSISSSGTRSTDVLLGLVWSCGVCSLALIVLMAQGYRLTFQQFSIRKMTDLESVFYFNMIDEKKVSFSSFCYKYPLGN